jgi:hypothetical protein
MSARRLSIVIPSGARDLSADGLTHHARSYGRACHPEILRLCSLALAALRMTTPLLLAELVESEAPGAA